MKKAKVFIAALLTSGLVLTGCTFEEGLEKAKSFTSEKIAQPVVNFWNEKILGKKAQEPEKEEKQDEGDKPAPAAEAPKNNDDDEMFNVLLGQLNKMINS